MPDVRDENPFERFGIDPHEGPRAITERMRELIEDASTEEDRRALREAWEALTLHPADRLHAALRAHPGTEPRYVPPPAPRRGASAPPALDARSLSLRPEVSTTLDLGSAPRSPSPLDALPLEDDPVLSGGRT